MRKMLGIGVLIAVVGVVLLLAFWPLTSVSGPQLLAARRGSDYPGFTDGAQITIRAVVADVHAGTFLGSSYTFLELRTSDATENVTVYVQGDAGGAVSVGETVYMTAVLHRVTILGQSLAYWEVPTPQDIHPSLPVDATFAGIGIAGLVVAALGALRDRARTPQG